MARARREKPSDDELRVEVRYRAGAGALEELLYKYLRGTQERSG